MVQVKVKVKAVIRVKDKENNEMSRKNKAMDKYKTIVNYNKTMDKVYREMLKDNEIVKDSALVKDKVLVKEVDMRKHK